MALKKRSFIVPLISTAYVVVVCALSLFSIGIERSVSGQDVYKRQPLRQAEDAVLVDTTGNTLEQSIAQLTALVKEKLHDHL